MKKLLHISLICLCSVMAHVHAEDNKTPSKAMEEKKHKGTQQDKMKHCNAEAKGLKGDQRKATMSACLKG